MLKPEKGLYFKEVKRNLKTPYNRNCTNFKDKVEQILSLQISPELLHWTREYYDNQLCLLILEINK